MRRDFKSGFGEQLLRLLQRFSVLKMHDVAANARTVALVSYSLKPGHLQV